MASMHGKQSLVVGCLVVCLAVVLCAALVRWRPRTQGFGWFTTIGGGNTSTDTVDLTKFDILYNGPPNSKFYNVFVKVQGPCGNVHYYYNRSYSTLHPDTGAVIGTGVVDFKRIVMTSGEMSNKGACLLQLTNDTWMPKMVAPRIMDSLYATVLGMGTDDFINRPNSSWYKHEWVKFNLALVARNVVKLNGAAWGRQRPTSDTKPLRLGDPTTAVVPLSSTKYYLYRVYVHGLSRTDANAVGYFASTVPLDQGMYAAYYSSAPSATEPFYFEAANRYMCVLTCLTVFKIPNVFSSSVSTSTTVPAEVSKELKVGTNWMAFYKLGTGNLAGQLVFAQARTDEYVRFAQCTNVLQKSILYDSAASITGLIKNTSVPMDERVAWLRLLATAATPTTPGMTKLRSFKVVSAASLERKIDTIPGFSLMSARTVSNVIVERLGKASSGPWIVVTYSPAMLEVATSAASGSSTLLNAMELLRQSLSIVNVALGGSARKTSKTVQCFVGTDGKLYNADPTASQPSDMGVSLGSLSTTNLLSPAIIV